MIFPTLFGSVLDYLSNESANRTNHFNNISTNTANYRIAQETNATNMALNQANIEMQERQNEINRQREDDAVRRRANDLVGAGLSKTLAAGSPASANAMAAPQNTFAAETGHAMQSYSAKPYKGFGQMASDLETAAYHRKQAQIADKELDLKGTQLDIAQQEADEVKRHNLASEKQTAKANEENKRYHDLMNEWHQAELDQNSKFHDDALKVDWANTKIKYLSYMSESANKEYQNLWYSTQIELAKNQDAREAKKLTADLAEASAKIAMYYSGIKVDQSQIALYRAQAQKVIQETVTEIARRRNLNAETKQILIDAATKVYNLTMAQKENTTTTGHIVSDSEAQQNALDRSSGVAKSSITGVMAISAIILKCFLGF